MRRVLTGDESLHWKAISNEQVQHLITFYHEPCRIVVLSFELMEERRVWSSVNRKNE